MGAFLSLSKVVGLAWQWLPSQAQNTSKRSPIALGPPAQQDPILLGVAKPDLKHFKKGLGLVAQPDPPILGLIVQPLKVSKKTEKLIKLRKLEKNKQKNQIVKKKTDKTD